MTVPLDNLARALLANALPHLWQKELASQEGAHGRQALAGFDAPLGLVLMQPQT